MSSLIKSILFPTDFSANSKKALPFALKLALENKAKLHLVHSIEEPYDFAPIVEDIKQNVTRKVEQLFEDLIDEVKKQKEFESLRIKSHLFEGRSVHSIFSATSEYDTDLIVMGTQGRGALERLFFGSTTSEVVQQSDVPVLVVPPHVKYEGFKKILFTTDYGDHDLEALEFVSDFASKHESSLKIIHITRKTDGKQDLLLRGLKDYVTEHIKNKRISFELIESSDLLHTVNEEVKKHNFSLVVTVRYQSLFSVIGKKHSKKMSLGTHAPLLVMPGKSVTSHNKTNKNS